MHRQQTSITIVRYPLTQNDVHGNAININVDRWQLAKMRWRGVAEDGRDFGFEVESPLHHGDIVCSNDYNYYFINQQPEPVLVVKMEDPETAAKTAWSIGNLHQLVQITHGEIIAADDSSLRQLYEQLHLHYEEDVRRFEPFRSVISHHHHHAH